MTPPIDQPDVLRSASVDDRQTVIPVFEEELSVAKRVVETGRVRVSRVTHDHQQMVDELLQHETVEVDRIPIGRQVEAMPPVRTEGDVTIIPVVEEVLKVERHLILKEEVAHSTEQADRAFSRIGHVAEAGSSNHSPPRGTASGPCRGGPT